MGRRHKPSRYSARGELAKTMDSMEPMGARCRNVDGTLTDDYDDHRRCVQRGGKFCSLELEEMGVEEVDVDVDVVGAVVVNVVVVDLDARFGERDSNEDGTKGGFFVGGGEKEGLQELRGA